MKIDRLFGIVMILLENKRIGSRELANIFEVSPRTIYRDIESINMAGIPVSAISGAGGGFEIMHNYKIDKQVFSSTDLSTILLGLSSISGMVRGDELVNALAKVRSIVPEDRAKDIESRANQICVDTSPWMSNRNMQAYLEIIRTAQQQRKLLSFDYVDRYGNLTARTAEPYQLVLKGSHWYWQGYCQKRNDFRLFKLSRTSKLQIQEQTFTPREYQKPQLEFNDVWEAMQTTIQIRIHKTVMERVLDFCPPEMFFADGDEYYIVRFPFIENDYYYNILFSFGDKCECLEPLHVRHEMQRRISNIAAIYGRQRN